MCVCIHQVPWLHATYAVLGAILFTLVGSHLRHSGLSPACVCGLLVVPFTVPGLRHPDAAGEQALRHKPGGIHIRHPQHLPGHRQPIQLPAADRGRRTRVTGRAPTAGFHPPPPTTSCLLKGCRVCFRVSGHLISAVNTTALLALSLCLRMENQPFRFLHLTLLRV